MSENTSTMQEVDPLTSAAGDYDTSFPVLAADRLLEFKLLKLTNKTSDKGTKTIQLKVELNSDSTFADGKPARKGFKFNQSINITPSENFTIESVKRQLALWNKALLGVEAAKSASFAAMRDEPSKFEGLVFKARTGIKKDKSGVYDDATVLTPVVPA